MKTYTEKHNAKRAAQKALGHTEFELVKTTDGLWYWIDISEAAAEAAGAENDPPMADAEFFAAHEPWEIPAAEATQPEAEAEGSTVAEPITEAATAPAAAQEPEDDPEAEEEKPNHTIDLGITPEIATLIEGLGKAAGAAQPTVKKRRGITAGSWEAVERGELPPPPDFPASNASAGKHAVKLHSYAKAGDWEALGNYQIGGTNTYSKALRDYQKALLHYRDTATAQKEAA